MSKEVTLKSPEYIQENIVDDMQDKIAYAIDCDGLQERFYLAYSNLNKVGCIIRYKSLFNEFKITHMFNTIYSDDVYDICTDVKAAHPALENYPFIVLD